MAKLITNHDPFHVHKTLGVLVLLHTLYRLSLWPYRGFIFCSAEREECSTQEIHFDVACNVLHLLLSCSSLLLPLPAKRNFSSPMIWKEFRWHSIIFASRSVMATIVGVLDMWPSHWALNYASKLGLVLATCYAADFATDKCGCRGKRTTNAMPYPDCITEEIERGIKFNYSIVQFNATIFCIIESPDSAWFPLIAIQGAPLLMTLVRKGKISALFYHRAYIIQLMLHPIIFPVANLIHVNLKSWELTTLGFVARDITAYLRMGLRQSKLVTWMVGVAIVNLFLHWQPASDALHWLHTTPIGWAMVFALINDFLIRRILCNFGPIFTLQTYNPKMPEGYVHDAVRFVVKVFGGHKINVLVGDDLDKDSKKTC